MIVRRILRNCDLVAKSYRDAHSFVYWNSADENPGSEKYLGFAFTLAVRSASHRYRTGICILALTNYISLVIFDAIFMDMSY